MNPLKPAKCHHKVVNLNRDAPIESYFDAIVLFTFDVVPEALSWAMAHHTGV